MYYLVYKTTCIINGKFYVGKHQTKNLDDGYLGSGKLIQATIKQYGSENFVAEILGSYETVWQMKLAERILVVRDPEVSYNVYPGGGGDFSYINNSGIPKFAGRKHKPETKRILAEKSKGNTSSVGRSPWNKGKGFQPLPPETCRKMSVSGKKRYSRLGELERHALRMKRWWAERKAAELA